VFFYFFWFEDAIEDVAYSLKMWLKM